MPRNPPPARPPLALPAWFAGRGIALRPQRDADSTFLRALYGAHRAHELAFAPWPAAAKARFLDDQFQLQSAHFAAQHGAADFSILTRTNPLSAETAIGRLYVDRRNDVWELLEIGLLPAEQRAGLGTAIVEFLQRASGEAGAIGVALHVANDNVRAAALYRRLGFEQREASSATHRRMEWRVPVIRRD